MSKEKMWSLICAQSEVIMALVKKGELSIEDIAGATGWGAVKLASFTALVVEAGELSFTDKEMDA
jgi:hypothetical protein